MIDTADRVRYPSDMVRAADPAAAELNLVESVTTELVDAVSRAARRNPLAFGLCVLGIGFILGWKLKPW